MKLKNSLKTNKGEIIIYKTKEGPRLEVRLEQETVWLDAHRIATLFGIDRTGIVRHIAAIYETGELNKHLTCAKIAQVAKDKVGQERQVAHQ